MTLKRNFTEESVRKLNAPRSGRREFGDGVVRGLVLRVTKNGLKTWSVIYKVPGEGPVSPKTGRRLKGTQKRITLGAFPFVNVADARSKATKILERVSAGCDPRPELQAQNQLHMTNTVEAIVRRFIDQDAKRNVQSWKKMERTFELHIFPQWGSRLVADVRRKDVHELLEHFPQFLNRLGFP